MCVLRVTGKRFEPAKFLASSQLKPCSVFHVGEPVVISRPRRIHNVAGFKVDVSRRSWDSLAGQVVDAVAFLQKHRTTLAKLRSIPEIEDVRLDFPLFLRIDRKNAFVQFDYFPPKLVSLAGALGCGLELSIYPRDLERLARRSGKARRARGGARR